VEADDTIAMIRISITPSSFKAIVALPFGSVGVEREHGASASARFGSRGLGLVG
jgi:hypothetical protein